jgi:hypothetical protein
MAMSWVAEAAQKRASTSQRVAVIVARSLPATSSRLPAMTTSEPPIQWRRSPNRSTSGDHSTLSDQANVRPE